MGFGETIVHLAKRIARVGIFDLAAAAAGMGLGIWTSLMTYTCPPCGPQEFCIMLLAQRFAAWQSALIGGATLAVILVVGGAVHSELRSVNLGAARSLQRWLFKDLSGTTPVAGTGSDAG